MMDEKKLYTIGCSSYDVEYFIGRLKRNDVNVIVDVRSVPYSKHTPQYNADVLKKVLKQNQILYMDFSKEFGARREENEVYVNNRVNFEKVMNLSIFQQGVERIKKGLESGYSIALMCTEKDPENCHRFSLVARGIEKKANICSRHILADGSVVSKESIEKKLLENMNIVEDLFDTKTPIDKLYERLEKNVAYSVNTEDYDD